VEARDFEMRKHLLEYDDVMNQQRQVIYNRRRDMLERNSVRDQVQEMIEETIDALLAGYADPQIHPEEWAWEDFSSEFSNAFFLVLPYTTEERAQTNPDELRTRLITSVEEAYQRRVQVVGEETFREVEKALLLHTIDTCWQEHLYEMDELKDGVGFAGVGGKNPLIEYKKGAYEMFESLIERINLETLRSLFQLRVDVEEPKFGPVAQNRAGGHRLIHREATNLGFSGVSASTDGEDLTGRRPSRRQEFSTSGGDEREAPAAQQPVRVGPKVGRNAPCPCGSGKKYKRCCGRAA
jgi:preprotein translocase subunit SecA